MYVTLLMRREALSGLRREDGTIRAEDVLEMLAEVFTVNSVYSRIIY